MHTNLLKWIIWATSHVVLPISVIMHFSLTQMVIKVITLRWQYLQVHFSRFWNPKHFTGIKFFDFHINMQTPAPPHTHAQWVARQLPKKIYAVLTLSIKLLLELTNLRLSFSWGLREYHKYRTTTLHEVLPTVHERSNLYNRYAISHPCDLCLRVPNFAISS